MSNNFQPYQVGVSHKKLQEFIPSRGIHKFETNRTWQSWLCHDTPLPCSPASSLEKTCDASQSPEMGEMQNDRRVFTRRVEKRCEIVDPKTSGLRSTISTSNIGPKFGSTSQLLSAFPSATVHSCWPSLNSIWKTLIEKGLLIKKQGCPRSPVHVVYTQPSGIGHPAPDLPSLLG